MGRDEALDAVRGLCIFSMVIGHVCYGSTLSRLVHPVPWVDGASGFVLLAGLVLGMVSRRRADAVGVARCQKRLARRIALLYGSQVALATLAVVISLSTAFAYNRLADVDHTPAGLMTWWLVTMQINPEHIDILSMYVVLLALAVVWVPLLNHRLWLLVVVSSAALHTLALAFDWGRFPNRPEGWATFDTAAWQALFGFAFVAGWYWSRLRDPLRSRPALAIALSGGAVVVAIGLVMHHFATGRMLFDKTNCGLGRIALAWVTFVVLYQAMRWVAARAPVLVSPVAVVGSRSLACFIALTIVGLLLPAAVVHHPTSPTAQVAAVLTVLFMYPVAVARGRAGVVLTRWRRGLGRVPERAGSRRQIASTAPRTHTVGE